MNPAPYTPDQWLVVMEKTTTQERMMWEKNDSWPPFHEIDDRTEDDEFKRFGRGGRETEERINFILDRLGHHSARTKRLIRQLLRSGGTDGTYMPRSVTGVGNMTPAQVGRLVIQVAAGLGEEREAFLLQIDD